MRKWADEIEAAATSPAPTEPTHRECEKCGCFIAVWTQAEIDAAREAAKRWEHMLLPQEKTAAPTLTPAEERFFQAAKVLCEAWEERFSPAEQAPLRANVRAAYRALSPGVMETKGGTEK